MEDTYILKIMFLVEYNRWSVFGEVDSVEYIW